MEQPIGTYLYGRRMYESMLYWETASLGDQPAFIGDFTQIWRGADKIVYSRSLAPLLVPEPGSSGASIRWGCGA